MINSHVHIIPEDTDAYAAALVKRMEEHNIRASVVFGSQCEQSTGDDEVEEIADKYSGQLIPFLTRTLDFDDPDSADRCIRKLDNGPWLGVGEIFLDCTDDLYVCWTDRDGNEKRAIKPVPREKERNPVFAEIFRYCGENDLPVLAHCMDADVMSRACSLYPETTFIWAHTDHEFWPTVPAGLLREHPNLICEFGVSFRFRSAGIVAGEMEQWEHDKIREWRKNCHEFPNRIVWGTDLFTWDDLDSNVFARGMQAWGLVASEIEPTVLEQITDANMARLLRLAEQEH